MATSGSSSFNETRDQIISNALQLLGYLAAGETATTADITYCSLMLNAMVKAWVSMGIHLWTEEEGTIYFVQGQASYTLPGANSSDGSGTPVETTLAVSAGAGASSVTLTTVVGISLNDTIGVCQDDLTTAWTTVSNIVGNTVTLTSPTTYAASIGNMVYTYTTALPRVLSIQDCRVRDSANFDIVCKMVPRMEYMRIPQKLIQGIPRVIYYTPQVGNGTVFVWPTPYDVSHRLKVTYLREIQDFTTGTDNPDFPQEWLECITYNLAVRIAPAYGINLQAGGVAGNPGLITLASQMLEDMKAWDAEQPYVKFIPGWDYRDGAY